MKLLFYIHSLSGGGAERVMATLMNGFVHNGHQVRVVYTEGNERPVYQLDSHIEQVYMLKECPIVSPSVFGKIYRRVWKYYAIRKQAKKYRPDFVISFIKVNNNDVLAALLGTGIPVIIGDHTNVDRPYPFLTSFLSDILYPYASAITMLTMQDYNKWKNKYKHVYYMPNPCDIELTHRYTCRRKIILGVGRVNQWEIKGFDNLIRAWAMIKDNNPGWICQIAGSYDDTALSTLRQEVGEDAFKTVEFIGFKSDIYDYMMSCEVFCLSSRTEGLPMVLLEAMNLGCACVAFDCNTGPAEIIEDGKTGLLVKNQDVRELAKKLDYIVSDDALRELFHQKAPLSVQRYSSNNILSMWMSMFDDLKHNT